MEIILNFKNFINEGKLFIDNDSTIQEDIEWKLILNLSPLWNQYERKEITQNQFNNAYSSFLENQKPNFEKLGCWKEFEKIIKNLKSTTNNNLYEHIYNIADKYLIKIEIDN
jgi:hypothetical protein